MPSAFAGPSEVVVIADDTTPVESAAIDVIVQAEHGPDGLAWLITWSEGAADAISAAIDRLVGGRPAAPTSRRRSPRAATSCWSTGRSRRSRSPTRSRPSTSSCCAPTPTALVPLVRHAGAVFCGPWAPASVGDYVAGPSHVLPTYGSARFGQALTVDDFTKQVHVVTLDEAALGEVAPARRRAGRGRGPRRARRVGAHPHRRGRRDEPAARSATTSRARGLPLAAGRRRGAAQHQRVARAAARRVAATRAPPSSPRRLAPLSRSRRHRAAQRDRRAPRRRDRAGLRGQRVERGAADAAARLRRPRPRRAASSRPTRCTPTSPASPARRSSRRAHADFALDLDEATRVLGEAQPAITFLCSPNNPTGMVETEATVRSVASWAPGLVVVDEAYGQFAPWSALALVDEDVPARRHPHVLEDVVDGRGPPRLPRRPVVARRRELDKVVLPYHLDAAKQIAGSARARRSSTRWRTGSPASCERERVVAGLCDLGANVWPSGANFVLFRPAHAGRRRLAGAARSRGARAQLRVVAAPRRLPAGHDRHAGRGRPLPPSAGGGGRDDAFDRRHAQRQPQGDRRSRSSSTSTARARPT